MKVNCQGSSRLAVSLGLSTTHDTLRAIHEVSDRVSIVEVCLDLMDEFDIPKLILNSPCDLILTNRPMREGGRFTGNEKTRLDPLLQGMRCGVAYVDIEWDSISTLLNDRPASPTKVIVSRHDFEGMPMKLVDDYRHLQTTGADVVKLAALASSPIDAAKMLELFGTSSIPTIALAMGKHGIPSRLLCLTASNCLLSYVSLNEGLETAEGQITLDQAIGLYRADRVDEYTAAFCLISPPDWGHEVIEDLNDEFSRRSLNAFCVRVCVSDLGTLKSVLVAYSKLPISGFSIAPMLNRAAYAVGIDLGMSASPMAQRADAIVCHRRSLRGLLMEESSNGTFAKRQVDLLARAHEIRATGS